MERNRLYVIDVGKDDGARRGASSRRGNLSVYADSTPGFDWSPDGKSIVFAHVPTPSADDWTKGDVSVVDVGTAAVRPLVHSRRAESRRSTRPTAAGSPTPPATIRRPGPSTRASISCPARVELLASWPTLSTTAPSCWDGRRMGRRFFFRENRGTTTRLYALPLDGEPQGFGPEEGVVAEASLNATRTAVGFGYQTAAQPPEAFLTRLEQPEPVQVSHAHKDLPERPLGRTEVVRWRSETAGRSRGF